MGKITVCYKVDGKPKQKTVVPDFSILTNTPNDTIKSLIISLNKKRFDMASIEDQVNAIQSIRQILLYEKSAVDFEIDIFEQTKPEKNGIIIFLSIILSVFIAPITVALGMKNKFLLKKIYLENKGKTWDKFRKIYSAIGLSIYIVFVLLLVIFAIVSVLKKLFLPFLTALFLFNIIYFILSIIMAKKLNKK